MNAETEPFTCMDFLFAKSRRPMLTVARIHMEGIPDLDRLRGELQQMARRFPRFASTVDWSRRWYRWVRTSPESMDWDYHIYQAPSGWSLDQLETEGLDRSRPLWRFILGPTDAPPAIYAVFDHVIGDGISMSEVLFRLCSGDKADFLPPRRKPPPPASPLVFLAKLLTFLVQHVIATWWVCNCETPNALRAKPEMGRINYHRFSTSVDGIAVDDVKRCRDLTGLTVGEILIACSVLATRKALRRHGDHRTTRIRLSVGANMRSGRFWDAPSRNFGNMALNFFFPLDIAPGEETTEGVCRSLLQQVRLNLATAMLSKVAEFTFWIIIRYAPWLGLVAVYRMSDPRNDKATLWVAPIVGPAESGCLAGRRVLAVESFASADVPLYCGLVSYGGQVKVSFTADPRIFDEVAIDQITRGVKEEFDVLKARLEVMQVPLTLRTSQGWMVGAGACIVIAMLAMAISKVLS